MAIEKIIDVKVQSESAENAVKSLRTQFREAQQDVAELSAKFGATSDEAVKAAKRASELKDQIGDAKALTDAFNPDAKFKSLSASLSGVAGGFAAVQGAMGLFGAESESVEKTLLKVQSAMAISQGIQAVGESIDSFKQLRAVVMSYSIAQKISTAAQWLWNTAMAANPVGAVITAIVALLAVGYKLVSWYMDTSEANETATQSINKNTKALENQSKEAQKSAEKLQSYNKYQYDLAKASGESSEQLRKLALKHKDEEIALNQKNTMLARSTFLRERDTLAMLKNSGASDEVIEAQEKLTQDTYKEFTKQRDSFYKSKEEKVALIRQQNVEIRQEQTNHNKEEEQKRKENAENIKEEQKRNFEDSLKDDELSFAKKREMVKKSNLFDASEKRKLLKEIDKEEKDQKKKDAEKEAEDLKKQKDDLKSIEEKSIKEIEDLKAESEREKLELQKQRDLEELDAVKLSEEEKAKARQAILEKYRLLNLEQDQKDAEEKTTKDLEKNQKSLENQSLSFEERKTLLDEQEKLIDEGVFKTEEDRTKAKEANAKARIELDKLESKAKMEALDAVSNTLASASDLLGKETEAGKALSVASATISTFVSAQKAYEATIGIPFVGPTLAPINAGLAVLSGLKNIQSILAVKVPNSSGGGASAPSIPSFGGGATASAPQFNVVGDSGTNQLASSLGGALKQNPVKSYVVASDVSSAQSLNRNIIQNASLG